MAMSTSISALRNFLEPESVIILGASRVVGEDNPNIVANLIDCSYSGKIYPINKNATEILGFKAYPRVKDVPGKVELAIIATPRDTVLQGVSDCVEKGIKAIVILAQGFADSDKEGRVLQEKIVQIAKDGGSRVLGPNTFGSSNAFFNFTTAFRPLLMEKIPIGLICQTGSLVMGFPNFKFIGKCFDLGNSADIDFIDALEYFSNDPEVKVIALHMEGLKEARGRDFIKVAKKAVEKKPVLVLKTGRSVQGAKSASSHTGCMVGDDKVYSGAFKQCGIIRANDIDELADLCRAFLYLPLMRSNRVGVITGSGGIGTLVADICEENGLRIAQLSHNTIYELDKLFPSWFSVSNPLDIAPAATIMGHPRQETYRIALRSLLKDDNVDAVMFVGAPIAQGESWDPSQPAIEVIREFPYKPVVFWLYGHYALDVTGRIEKENTTLVFPSVSRAIKVLHSLWYYYHIKYEYT